MLLAIDPGINKSGVALFRDERLIAAATVESKAEGDLAFRCAEMARAIRNWLLDVYIAVSHYGYDKDVEEIEEIVFEWPRIYPGERGKRPNDLPALVGVGMAVIGAIAPKTMKCYYPADWAGQIPKAKTKKLADDSPRAIRIKEHLGDSERMHWPHFQHDAIDAIGIGLFHLGRLWPKKVFPGATR